ncbi:MAG: hypothetical protein Q9220_002313 [cf. Caloplaca sp. 1 TL-2023]
MTFTILPPLAPPTLQRPSSPTSDLSLSSDSDDPPPPSKHLKRSPKTTIITPGETITDDPQWMRGHGTHNPPHTPSTILATVAGTLLRTNKLLSILPLRARYYPEIGDLVIGRIVSVESRRWKVDLSAPLLAHLPLSAINLPGGILRKRTSTDELAIRSFFSEGDLVVAEVQGVYGDGAAGLHTRSLRYGKLRNGVFIQVSGAGGGGGGKVVRARRQVWTIDTDTAAGGKEGGGGEIDVVLGVNGYIWICAHTRGELVASSEEAKRMNEVTRMEDSVSESMYSGRNDYIGAATRREIARLSGVVRALVENGVRVDEEMVMAVYRASLDMSSYEEEGEEGEADEYLGGSRGSRLVAAALESVRG